MKRTGIVVATVIVVTGGAVLGLTEAATDSPGTAVPGGGGAPVAEPTTGPPVTTPVSTTPPATPPPPPATTPPVTTPPPPSTSGPALVEGIGPGDIGPAVLALEERLGGLGFWLGPPDDAFDETTTHALVAFQKVAGLPRHGILDPATAAALQVAGRPAPRSAEGRVVEVDLTRQIVVVAEAGQALAILDTSTGRRAGTTPTGRFSVTREIDGYRRSPLGVLYRPKYFHQGVALHGYPSVPPEPASHGCVRLTNAAMDWLWASGLVPVGTPVWVYA